MAVINYAGADYDLRVAWSIRHDTLPQLRLFGTTGELPRIIPGLHKGSGSQSFDGLTSAQQSVRAMMISNECKKQLTEHRDGMDVKRRANSALLIRRKSEL